MRILVTGGAGFIGSHLVKRLPARGAAVRVLDNLSPGRHSNLPPHAALDFIEGDIRDRNDGAPVRGQGRARGCDRASGSSGLGAGQRLGSVRGARHQLRRDAQPARGGARGGRAAFSLCAFCCRLRRRGSTAGEREAPSCVRSLPMRPTSSLGSIISVFTADNTACRRSPCAFSASTGRAKILTRLTSA